MKDKLLNSLSAFASSESQRAFQLTSDVIWLENPSIRRRKVRPRFVIRSMITLDMRSMAESFAPARIQQHTHNIKRKGGKDDNVPSNPARASILAVAILMFKAASFSPTSPPILLLFLASTFSSFRLRFLSFHSCRSCLRSSRSICGLYVGGGIPSFSAFVNSTIREAYFLLSNNRSADRWITLVRLIGFGRDGIK